jgi:hypothetical protein
MSYPIPTVPVPDYMDMLDMLMEGECEATDGCTVEPDGECEHGHPSWLLVEGSI